MKLDIEALAREAGGATVGNYAPQCWSGQLAFNKAKLQDFVRLIVERCAAECESRLAGDAKLLGEHLANRLRQLLEDK